MFRASGPYDQERKPPTGATWWALPIATSLVSIGCGDDSANDETNGRGPEILQPPAQQAATLGESISGQYHLGPVDFSESQWHNACAPGGGYVSALWNSTGLGGEYLAGVSNTYNDDGAVCDKCILIETALGRSVVARIVTYGVEQEPGDIDVSASVYEALNLDEYPRSMTWQIARCPDAGTISYEFKTGSNPYWTSLWVRDSRLPLASVSVRPAQRDTFTLLEREGDGSLFDATGFGDGAFTLRLTATSGDVLEETLPGFEAGQLIVSDQQFE